MLDLKTKDLQRYSQPPFDGVPVLYVANEFQPSAGPDLIIQLLSGVTTPALLIRELDSCFVPQYFALIYDQGKPRWHPNIPLAGQIIEDAVPDAEDGAHNDGGRINEFLREVELASPACHRYKFFAYYLFERAWQFNSSSHHGRLLQELIVDC